MDRTEFLRWVEPLDGRYEFIGGQPVKRLPQTRQHGRTSSKIQRELDGKLNDGQWVVWGSDIYVEVGTDLLIPDVMVEPAGLDGKACMTKVPVLIAEILSPASTFADISTKPTLYFQIPSLEAYIVASQDEPYLWVWQRSRDAARTFPDKPEEIDDPTASVSLTHLGITLPLAEIYRGIFAKT
jgi:Uma2 family endonuclease